MAFSDFNLRSAVETFGLQEDRDSDLFAQVAPLDISEFTRCSSMSSPPLRSV